MIFRKISRSFIESMIFKWFLYSLKCWMQLNQIDLLRINEWYMTQIFNKNNNLLSGSFNRMKNVNAFVITNLNSFTSKKFVASFTVLQIQSAKIFLRTIYFVLFVISFLLTPLCELRYHKTSRFMIYFSYQCAKISLYIDQFFWSSMLGIG